MRIEHDMRRDLERLEQRWGLAVQSAGFGVWDLDVPSQTVHYPPQWKAMLGYAGTEAADSTATWRARVHPDDLQPMLDALHAHLAGRSAAAYEAEFRLRAADGSYRWVLSRGRVVERGEAGEALRAIGTLTDLTDRRAAERLRLERDRAEATSRVKTEFIGRMSHELRTPLNAVLGFAQVLSARIGPTGRDDERLYLRHIEEAGWQLLQMIDDVLDLSRVEDKALAVVLESVALAPLVQAASRAMEQRARQCEVRLVPPELPAQATVRADAARLRQVLAKLLSNAIEFNRPGGSVTIRAKAAARGWTLAVADTGIGIPAAAMPRLFEPFDRLGRDDSGVDGMGIGLVLARALVETMGGTLEAWSTEGVGSSFELTLPAGEG